MCCVFSSPLRLCEVFCIFTGLLGMRGKGGDGGKPPSAEQQRVFHSEGLLSFVPR